MVIYGRAVFPGITTFSWFERLIRFCFVRVTLTLLSDVRIVRAASRAPDALITVPLSLVVGIRT